MIDQRTSGILLAIATLAVAFLAVTPDGFAIYSNGDKTERTIHVSAVVHALLEHILGPTTHRRARTGKPVEIAGFVAPHLTVGPAPHR
ncbi:MAG: hypothetical protein GF331_08375 [Chitinivibrionales bacterium]|nr:hypothetical protein [Chitinivibrionales bacterium]